MEITVLCANFKESPTTFSPAFFSGQILPRSEIKTKRLKKRNDFGGAFQSPKVRKI
jgi:hypothetical protein